MLERRRDLARTLDHLDNALLVVAGVVVVALVFHVLAWTVGLIYSFGRIAFFILVIGLLFRFFSRRR
jgi:uncharacterized membrane protein SirB2